GLSFPSHSVFLDSSAVFHKHNHLKLKLQVQFLCPALHLKYHLNSSLNMFLSRCLQAAMDPLLDSPVRQVLKLQVDGCETLNESSVIDSTHFNALSLPKK